jgi:hypothetical protein
MDSRIRSINTAIPGVVVSYDATTQRAEVQPTIAEPLRTRDGERIVEGLPRLANVPVNFPRAGNFRITMPVSPGDRVLVVFSKWAIGEYLRTAETVDPGDSRSHSLAGATAFLGCVPDEDVASGVSTTGIAIVAESTQVHVTPTHVNLGSASPADFVALASKVDGELQKIAATLLTGSNGGGTVVQHQRHRTGLRRAHARRMARVSFWGAIAPTFTPAPGRRARSGTPSRPSSG